MAETKVAEAVLAPGALISQLESAVLATPRCFLKPASFFVSWQGVVTLAYKGFPEPLLNLKEKINEHYTSFNKENPGSKWPKTSLGCVKDNKRLTPEQLKTLLAICMDVSGYLQQPQSPKAQSILVDKLSVVVFECRSLERRVLNHVVELTEEVHSGDPSAAEAANVERVLAESEDADYWYHAAKDGNREAHYRGSALGVTLVHDIEAFKAGSTLQYGSGLAGIVQKFRDSVDQALPGMYTWFADDSLHVTVRGILG